MLPRAGKLTGANSKMLHLLLRGCGTPHAAETCAPPTPHSESDNYSPKLACQIENKNLFLHLSSPRKCFSIFCDDGGDGDGVVTAAAGRQSISVSLTHSDWHILHLQMILNVIVNISSHLFIFVHICSHLFTFNTFQHRVLHGSHHGTLPRERRIARGTSRRTG